MNIINKHNSDADRKSDGEYSGYTNGGGEVSLASTVYADMMDEDMQTEDIKPIMHLVKIFESHLNQRFKHFENVMNTKFAEAKESMDEKFAESKESTNIQFANVDKRFDEFKESMNEKFEAMENTMNLKFANAEKVMNAKFAAAEKSTNIQFDALKREFLYVRLMLGIIFTTMLGGGGFFAHLILKLLGG